MHRERTALEKSHEKKRKKRGGRHRKNQKFYVAEPDRNNPYAHPKGQREIVVDKGNEQRDGVLAGTQSPDRVIAAIDEDRERSRPPIKRELSYLLLP